MPKFGDVLKELRKGRELSQAGLAEKLGWNQSKISYLEALEEVPKEEDLRALCELFTIGPDYFYERRQDRKPSALTYLRLLADSPPETSPKAAIAFYSQVGRLPKEEQARAVELVQRQTRRPPARRKK